MAYQHGIRIMEQPTSIIAPIEGTAGLQVIFGTAPVNLAKDPYGVTNKPVIVYNWAEAVSKLGYSAETDALGFHKYTLCASMYTNFKLFGIAPAIFVNVLDPAKHNRKLTKAAEVVDFEALIEETGILQDTVKVSVEKEVTVTADAGAGEGEDSGDGADLDADTPTEPTTKTETVVLVNGKDYILGFDDNGYLEITLTSTGAGADATSLQVEATAIDPSAVTAADVIGVSTATTDTGLEVIRQVYPKLGMTPGLLLAPGWSHIPDVGIVLAAKCEEINGYFTCEGFVDIDSRDGKCDAYDLCKQFKEAAGCTSKHIMALWPCISVGSLKFWYSAVMASLTAYLDASNDDIPNLSPSNKLIGITGTVLASAALSVNEDGVATWDKEVLIDRLQGNAVNSFGVTTAINNNGWRTWGNNTACYPASTDVKDRWFCCRRFFSWWGNSIILTYAQKVDDPANRQLIESIIDSENIRGNSYVARGKCAAAYVEFSETENPVTNLLNGKITFHVHLAPYTPAEDILFILEYDPDALATALNGG